MVTKVVRERREQLVREHMESENAHDYDTTIGTFTRPRYELIATDEVFDGEDEVRQYFADSRTAFPDQRNELIALHHADDAVIVEFILRGTHLGRLRSLPATGRSFEARMTAFFLFEDDADLVVERVYFDAGTILQQLGVLDDVRSTKGRLTALLAHPLTIGGAVLRSLRRSP